MQVYIACMHSLKFLTFDHFHRHLAGAHETRLSSGSESSPVGEGKRRPVRQSARRGVTAVSLSGAMVLSAFVSPAMAETAKPIVPDSFPNVINPAENFQPQDPQYVESPEVSVTFEDGTPAEGATVHRGDVLIVRGSGFNPSANRGGYPLPIPPGVPNGVYVLYSAFPDSWKPSEGAPSSSRKHPHDNIAWVTPAGTLEAIPNQGVDMRRSIARQATPMTDDGSFEARIVVNPPETPAGENWGIYVYPAAGSINEAEEIYIPLNYSDAPGKNAPAPSSEDLVISVSALEKVFGALGGGVTAKNGALEPEDGVVSFTRDNDNSDAEGESYRGEVHFTAKFSLVHVVVRNPRIEDGPTGKIITAEVSQGYDVGPDEMERMPIAAVVNSDGDQLITTIGTISQIR